VSDAPSLKAPSLNEAPALNVVIVDDHVALRRGMELLLRNVGCHVVGTADTAEEAESMILGRRPDVTLVDLALPGENGAALTRRLLARDPDLRIILYTGSADEHELLDGLDAGAAGFALKSGPPEELRDAIRTVAEGGEYLDPRLTSILAHDNGQRRFVLSPRERQILALLSKGLSGEDAAQELHLSPETVRTHVRNAMSKLDASTRVHAVALALQRGEIQA
jgi:DNA-binding NarL/FixJ family response regulator